MLTLLLGTIDTFGRRALLIFTFPNMAWSLLVAGLCALTDKTTKVHIGLVATFVYIFAMFYSPGKSRRLLSRTAFPELSCLSDMLSEAGIVYNCESSWLTPTIGEGPVPFTYSAEVFRELPDH